MNEQPTYIPSLWRARWYHIKRLCFRIFRRRPRFDVNQALKNQRWQVWQEARSLYLGRCPEHPEDGPMMNLHSGNYRCGTCWARDYFRSLDAGPVTDPKLQPLQITDAMTLAQRHPSLALRKLQHPTGGTPTQEFRAVHWPKTGEKKG